MKQTILVLITAGLFASCNNSTPDTPAPETTAKPEPKPAITYPYTAIYSSDFSMGNPELIKVVLDMYKAVEDNKMDELGKYYADSVIRYNFAEKQMTLTRDEMVKLAKRFRAQFKEFSETPLAFTALHANDKNEDWVLTWIKEKVVYNNGKVDSTIYQENWRFRDGKIYLVDSYAKYAK